MPAGPAPYRELFDERGDRYDDAMVRWPRVRDEEFAFVAGLAQVQPGERVLDVPAGGGYLGEHLPDDATVVALEPSAPFAARSRQRGLAVVAGSLDAGAIADASIDVVISVAGVHHEADPGALLAAWRRVLVPGGRVVLADVAEASAPAAFLDGYVGRHNGQGHRGRYLGADLEAVARAAGFVEAEVVDGSYCWWAADRLELASFCQRLFGLREVGLDDVVGAMEAGPGIDVLPDGRAGLRWGLRALVARSG